MDKGIQKELRLHICSKEEAEEILTSGKGKLLTHLVSIGEPGSKPPLGFREFAGGKLRLEFDDITQAGGWSAVMAGYQIPQLSDALALHTFCKRAVLVHAAPRVLIHCAQGISRSGAAGMALLFMHFGDAVKASQEIYALRDDLHPNPLFIALLDECIGANSELVRTAGLYALTQDNDEATIERRRDEYGG